MTTINLEEAFKLEHTSGKLASQARVRELFAELPTNEHILDVARRVHPVWVLAHGTKADRGVEHLATEIAHCVAALMSPESMGDSAIGHGLFVQRGPGIHGWSVCVTAGEVFDLNLAHPERGTDRPPARDAHA